MAQISKGDTFNNGEQVTGARLNQLVDSATLLVAAITDQPSITANTLQATDTTLVNDAGVLKEATISDFLNSGLPVTTSTITGSAGVDVVINPAAGQKVDINADLEVGTITSTGTDFIKIATGTTAQRPASPVAGQLRFNTSTNTLEVYSGTLWINGANSGSALFDGTVNITGAVQFNGTPVFGLYEIVQQEVFPSVVLSVANTYVSVFTSASYTKPADEIWKIEIVGTYQHNTSNYVHGRLFKTTPLLALAGFADVDHSGVSTDRLNPLNLSAVENVGSSGTSTYSFQLSTTADGYNIGVGAISQIYLPNNTTVIPATVFRIYKYKTA